MTPNTAQRVRVVLFHHLDEISVASPELSASFGTVKSGELGCRRANSTRKVLPNHQLTIVLVLFSLLCVKCGQLVGVQCKLWNMQLSIHTHIALIEPSYILI